MTNQKIKTILIIFLLFGFVLQAGIVLGAKTTGETGTNKTKLEVEYPKMPDTDEPTSFEKFVKYVFVFILITGGLLCLGIITYGGAIYLTSSGNISIIADAKKRIFEGFLGLMILLLSYLILFTINPALTVIKLEKKEPPQLKQAGGFYLCSQSCDKTDDKCIIEHCSGVAPGEVNIKKENTTSYLFFQPKDCAESHLVVFFDKQGEPHNGGAILFFHDKNDNSNNYTKKNFNGEESFQKAKSIRVYTFDSDQSVGEQGKGVRFYQYAEDFGKQDRWEGAVFPQQNVGDKKFYKANLSGYSQTSKLGEVRAMEMEGLHMVLLFKESSFKGNCKFLIETDAHLGANFQNTSSLGSGESSSAPYASIGSMVILPANY
ncbi:MAG: hypothetical protein U9P88_01840 [Patescibacteria group bacterium]|nr:hypothetical protein [Patescibacteria group bacterium]